MVFAFFAFFAFAGCLPAGSAWFSSTAVDLAVDPPALDFGEVQLGTEAYLDLSLGNAGAGSAATSITVEGPFGVLADQVEVASGATVTVTVFFAPVDYAAAAGSVSFSAGGTVVSVALSGSTNPDSDEDGVDAVQAGGTDCDDRDATVNPGAPDACYDGVDSDCAGDDDFDCDGDGHREDVDCDDADPAVHPGAPDGAPENGADDDCDGLVDEDLLSAGDLVFTEISLVSSEPWFEACNRADRAIPIRGFVLGNLAGVVELAGSDVIEVGECLVACDSLGAPCTHAVVLALQYTAGDLIDRFVLAAGPLELDVLNVQAPWAWAEGSTWGLDRSQLDGLANDNPDNWCELASPSKGELNTHHCP